MNNSYKIISLGRNCFPKTILTNYGLKPTKEQGELTMPFDLCLTPTSSLIKILKNDFIDYFDDLYFDKKVPIWTNKKYNIYYNHDKDCDASQKDKLVERFSKRIENFKQALCSDKFIYFVLDSDFEIPQSYIDKLYKTLCTIQNKQTGGGRRLSGGFKLIILDFFKSKLKSPDENNVEIIELPHPYELFERDWWCVECQKSHQGLLFKKSAAVLISKIIEKQHKIELFNDKLKLNDKKRIFINFTDMPSAYIGKHNSWYNNHFITLLEDYYDIVITEKPDFLFYTVFGDNFKKYKNCVKIYFTGEIAAPNFNQCDYAMGFDFINFEDRYYRRPIYFYEVDEKINDKSNITDDMAKRKFCNFIYTSEVTGEGCQIRKEFCQKLSEYKHIDCPGKVLNNMPNEILDKPGETYKESKLKFQKDYKFTIAFENNSYNGYTTEKIAQAFAANTIPIYWGDPEVTRDFNPKAFINCADYNSFDEVIERVKELDNNDEEYLKMLREPAMREGYNFNKQQELADFLIHIIEKGNKPFNKLPNPCFNKDCFVDTAGPMEYRYISKLKFTKCRYNILRKVCLGKTRIRYEFKYFKIKKQLKEIHEKLSSYIVF